MNQGLHAETLESSSYSLPLGGRSLEVAMHRVPGATETILMLHEALGSVPYWKDFPAQMAAATGRNVLLYSRPGHGSSEGPTEPRGNEHYLRQIEIVIPALLDHFGIAHPIVYGHSEGASIAVVYAAKAAGTAHAPRLLILESPFLAPMPGMQAFLKNMADEYPNSKLQERLSLYHQKADEVFYAWIDWARSETGPVPSGEMVTVSESLRQIACPVLVLQGANDPFGTTAHRLALEESLNNLQIEILPEAGHLPHREQTDAVLARVERFLSESSQPSTANAL